MRDSGTKYFNIQMAAQLSGLSAHTIRAWEKRYNALTPDRSDTGRRQYSTIEVERLGLLGQLTKLDNSIGQISHLNGETLKDIYLKMTQPKNGIFEVRQEVQENSVDIDSLLNELLSFLKSYKINEVFQKLQDIRYELSAKDLALNSIIEFHSGTIIYSHLQKKVKTQNKLALATLENDYDIFIQKIMNQTSDEIKVWMVGYDDKKTTKEYGKKVQYFGQLEDLDFALGELS